MPTLRPICPAEVLTGQFGTINFAKESKGTIPDGLVKCAACKPSQMLTRLILVPTVCFVLF